MDLDEELHTISFDEELFCTCKTNEVCSVHDIPLALASLSEIAPEPLPAPLPQLIMMPKPPYVPPPPIRLLPPEKKPRSPPSPTSRLSFPIVPQIVIRCALLPFLTFKERCSFTTTCKHNLAAIGVSFDRKTSWLNCKDYALALMNKALEYPMPSRHIVHYTAWRVGFSLSKIAVSDNLTNPPACRCPDSIEEMKQDVLDRKQQLLDSIQAFHKFVPACFHRDRILLRWATLLHLMQDLTPTVLDTDQATNRGFEYGDQRDDYIPDVTWGPEYFVKRAALTAEIDAEIKARQKILLRQFRIWSHESALYLWGFMPADLDQLPWISEADFPVWLTDEIEHQEDTRPTIFYLEADLLMLRQIRPFRRRAATSKFMSFGTPRAKDSCAPADAFPISAKTHDLFLRLPECPILNKFVRLHTDQHDNTFLRYAVRDYTRDTSFSSASSKKKTKTTTKNKTKTHQKKQQQPPGGGMISSKTGKKRKPHQEDKDNRSDSKKQRC